jgi:3-methyladenine DNA glycosylase/8-oxoguanine DNA glycosylase
MAPDTALRQLRADGIAVRATLRPLGVFRSDPTHRWSPNGFAKSLLTPAGPASMRLTWTSSGHVGAQAWGPGGAWALEQAPRWVGLHDDLTGFDPSVNAQVAELWRRRGPIRLASTGLIWQNLVFVILGQRVTTQEAMRSWLRLVRACGEPAPGPDGLRLPPSPDVVASLSYVDLHRMNVERRRADAIVLAAKRANRLEEAASMNASDALVRLSALPGLGVWTATSTITTSHGDPDTIVLRDYGLPTMVNYAFTGDARRIPADEGGDERMCEHLAPWAGHRQRIVRLLSTGGMRPPRRAPRAVNPDIRRL